MILFELHDKTVKFIQANPKKFNEKRIKIANTYLNSLYDKDDKENMSNKVKMLEELKLIFFNNKEEVEQREKALIDKINQYNIKLESWK